LETHYQSFKWYTAGCNFRIPTGVGIVTTQFQPAFANVQKTGTWVLNVFGAEKISPNIIRNENKGKEIAFLTLIFL
jgi:hypothetical protein